MRVFSKQAAVFILFILLKLSTKNLRALNVTMLNTPQTVPKSHKVFLKRANLN